MTVASYRDRIYEKYASNFQDLTPNCDSIRYGDFTHEVLEIITIGRNYVLSTFERRPVDFKSLALTLNVTLPSEDGAAISRAPAP